MVSTGGSVPTTSKLSRGVGAAAPGLRERKKRELRQRLSDTATAMFLERGFQNVRVRDVAVACQVSEKTVFNYFPTKESLLFDGGDTLVEALSAPFPNRRAVLDAVVGVLIADLDRLDADTRNSTVGDAIQFINRFSALVAETPALRAAMAELFDRLARAATEALARATATGADAADDRIVGIALIGLWQVQVDALWRHAATEPTPARVRQAVLDDLERATTVVKKII